jgi:hypothetical protein
MESSATRRPAPATPDDRGSSIVPRAPGATPQTRLAPSPPTREVGVSRAAPRQCAGPLAGRDQGVLGGRPLQAQRPAQQLRGRGGSECSVCRAAGPAPRPLLLLHRWQATTKVPKPCTRLSKPSLPAHRPRQGRAAPFGRRRPSAPRKRAPAPPRRPPRARGTCGARPFEAPASAAALPGARAPRGPRPGRAPGAARCGALQPSAEGTGGPPEVHQKGRQQVVLELRAPGRSEGWGGGGGQAEGSSALHALDARVAAVAHAARPAVEGAASHARIAGAPGQRVVPGGQPVLSLGQQIRHQPRGVVPQQAQRGDLPRLGGQAGPRRRRAQQRRPGGRRCRSAGSNLSSSRLMAKACQSCSVIAQGLVERA